MNSPVCGIKNASVLSHRGARAEQLHALVLLLQSRWGKRGGRSGVLGACHQRMVNRFQLVDGIFHVVRPCDVAVGSFTDLMPARVIIKQSRGFPSQRVHVTWRYQDSSFATLDHLVDATYVGGKHRDVAGTRFQ